MKVGRCLKKRESHRGKVEMYGETNRVCGEDKVERKRFGEIK